MKTFSSNGGFNLIPLKDSIINNNKTIEYIHFFHDNSFLISNYGYTLTTTDTGYKVNKIQRRFILTLS